MITSRLARTVLAALLAAAAALGVSASHVVHSSVSTVVADPERCC